VPLVSNPAASACLAERLARAGSGPDVAVVFPASEAQCVRPTAEASEHVDLAKSPQIGGVDVTNVSFINFSIGDQACSD
jgi:hypothetical protein